MEQTHHRFSCLRCGLTHLVPAVKALACPICDDDQVPPKVTELLRLRRRVRHASQAIGAGAA